MLAEMRLPTFHAARALVIFLLSILSWAFAQEPRVIPLWDKGAPGFESRRNEPEQAKDYWVKNINNPSITVFLPPKEIANGTAVVIAPGGGHSLLVYGAEGVEPAKFLNRLGVAAFVLKYRLAREPNSPYKLGVEPKEDALRAMRLVRSRAAEFGIDPNKVGFLGFSAGGEVGFWVCYGSGAGDPNAPDPVDRLNAKPNFHMSIYPGPLGLPDSIQPDDPPTFMVVANDDEGHSDVVIDLLKKYHAAKVPIEVHFYAKGGHGFNLGQRSNLVSIRGWPQRMVDWMTDGGWLASNAK